MEKELTPTITPQTELTPTGHNSTSRSFNKKHLGGNGPVNFTTSKALRETAAMKRLRHKTQQDDNS